MRTRVWAALVAVTGNVPVPVPSSADDYGSVILTAAHVAECSRVRWVSPP